MTVLSLRIRTKTSGALASIVAASGLSAQGSAAQIPGLDSLRGYFEPDISGLRAVLEDAVDTLISDPNIYASFDHNAMLDFVMANTLTYLMGLGLAAVYLFALVMVVFRSRKKDPGRR